MQVPTITIADLQAFQAKHFPGQPQPQFPAYPLTEPTLEESVGDDEPDLGYYPDGVKRTLTDEQIRIFRHSEIHSLLRAKQLREDDAEYQARRELTADDQSAAEIDSEREKRASVATASPESSGVKDQQVSTRKESKMQDATRDDPAMSSVLDYEDAPEKISTQSQAQASSRPSYSRRKIVSYDD